MSPQRPPLRQRLAAPLGLLIALCLLASCASAGRNAARPAPNQRALVAARADSPNGRERVLAWAQSLLGKPYESKATVRSKAFVLDCVGTISAAWWGAGYDIRKDFSKHEGNGVKRLWESLKAWGALGGEQPRPGDLIFWDSTWDRNGNGVRYDDGVTHAGIVLAVDPDGTIAYLHASVSRGVSVAWCNLRHPDQAFGPGGKVWNSPMYLGAGHGKPNNPPRWLSGELWSGFGDSALVNERLARP